MTRWRLSARQESQCIMSRIQSTLAALAANNRKGLIPFITAGDPAPELTVPLMHALVAGGADIIELGVPFSDPMADGPVIQRASERALANGIGMRHVLQFVREFRATDQTTPIVLTNTSRAANEVINPMPICQSKPSGLITGAMR